MFSTDWIFNLSIVRTIPYSTRYEESNYLSIKQLQVIQTSVKHNLFSVISGESTYPYMTVLAIWWCSCSCSLDSGQVEYSLTSKGTPFIWKMQLINTIPWKTKISYFPFSASQVGRFIVIILPPPEVRKAIKSSWVIYNLLQTFVLFWRSKQMEKCSLQQFLKYQLVWFLAERTRKFIGVFSQVTSWYFLKWKFVCLFFKI